MKKDNLLVRCWCEVFRLLQKLFLAGAKIQPFILYLQGFATLEIATHQYAPPFAPPQFAGASWCEMATTQLNAAGAQC